MAAVATLVLNAPVPYVQIVADWEPNAVLWRYADGQPRAQVAVCTNPGAAANPGAGLAAVSIVWEDYEIPQTLSTTYRVGLGTVSNAVTMPEMGPWLIDRTNPALSVQIDGPPTMFSGWTRSKVVNSAAIVDSDTPFNVSLTRQRPSGQLVLQQLTQDDHTALIACLNSPGPKLLSFSPSWWPAQDVSWVEISDVTDTPMGTAASVLWQVTLTLIPNGVPPVVTAVVAGDQWITEAGSWMPWGGVPVGMPDSWTKC